METYFAPAERADVAELADATEIARNNAVLSSILNMVGGVIAILNENRQVLSVNDAFLRTLGIDDPETTLGLRPGEILKCEHAFDEPAGCGTTPWCRSCGAAIAMVTCQNKQRAVERLCTIRSVQEGKARDLTLHVRAQPITIEGRKFLLLFLSDVTRQQHRAALERTFFHDMNNVLGTLLSASDLLSREDDSQLARIIHRTTQRLVKEVEIQRCLTEQDTMTYKPTWETIEIDEVFHMLEEFFKLHPTAEKRHLDLHPRHPQQLLHTDSSLLARILENMVINALEATEEHGSVKVWVERNETDATFHVWNSTAIPEDTAKRVFQRHFSTKNQDGRGMGTFSMKILGEQLLGGHVSFTSTPESGTLFRFKLPLVWHGALTHR
jgi:signal transduction histidine kinase